MNERSTFDIWRGSSTAIELELQVRDDVPGALTLYAEAAFNAALASRQVEPVATVHGSGVHWIPPGAGKLRDNAPLYAGPPAESAAVAAVIAHAEKIVRDAAFKFASESPNRKVVEEALAQIRELKTAPGEEALQKFGMACVTAGIHAVTFEGATGEVGKALQALVDRAREGQIHG